MVAAATVRVVFVGLVLVRHWCQMLYNIPDFKKDCRVYRN
jgi:hypothetical protein